MPWDAQAGILGLQPFLWHGKCDFSSCFSLQDRKRQYELLKLERDFQKQANVLRRKTEEVRSQHLLGIPNQSLRSARWGWRKEQDTQKPLKGSLETGKKSFSLCGEIPISALEVSQLNLLLKGISRLERKAFSSGETPFFALWPLRESQ